MNEETNLPAGRARIPEENIKEQISNFKEEEINENILEQETVARTDSQTQNLKPETENMEVHHHPDLHHRKKHWKEYFLEFLMIFLAVTLGFFAENLREYFADREKEIEYMHLLAEDLKNDTASLNLSIRNLEYNDRCADILIVLYAKNKLKEQDDSTILKLSHGVGISVDVVFNDRASSQLKSSGSMRLIRHKNITDSILQYWNNQLHIDQIHTRFDNQRLEQRKVGFKTFNWYKGWYTTFNIGSDSSVYNLPVKAFTDARNLSEFVNASALIFNIGAGQYMPKLKKQLTLATELIEQIQKEYPFGK